MCACPSVRFSKKQLRAYASETIGTRLFLKMLGCVLYNDSQFSLLVREAERGQTELFYSLRRKITKQFKLFYIINRVHETKLSTIMCETALWTHESPRKNLADYLVSY